MARSISARGNPMLSMFSIAAARSVPIVNDDGSLKLRSVAAAAGAGDGVAGGFAEGTNAGAGAAGAEGVWAGSRAGVDGAALLDEAPGAALGWRELVKWWWQRWESTDLGNHTHDEALLFNVV
jgi:hypothetical protein